MLKKKVKILFVFVILVVIGIFSINIIQSNNKSEAVIENERKEQEQKIIREIAAEHERKLAEELLRAKIAKANIFVQNVSKETEIILHGVNGEYPISDDKTPEDNVISEWINNSEITINYEFRTIFAIKTKYIYFNITPEGTVQASYDTSKIVITAIDILNTVPIPKTSTFGKPYSPIEVIGLENIAKEEIKKQSYTSENIVMASENLKNYIENMSKSFGIENITITEIV